MHQGQATYLTCPSLTSACVTSRPNRSSLGNVQDMRRYGDGWGIYTDKQQATSPVMSRLSPSAT